MTFTCDAPEQVVFDEHAIDGTTANVEVEMVFDFARRDELHFLDMRNDF